MTLAIPNSLTSKTGQVQLGLLDENFTYLINAITPMIPLVNAVSVVNTTNLLLGSIEPATATATPVNINLGGTYSSVAGQKPKLSLWSDGAGTTFGLGVSLHQQDYMAPSDAAHVFYTGTNESLRIDTARNVGIGSTAPTQLLTLSSSTNFPFIHWNNSANTTIAFAGWHGGTGGGDDFRIGTLGAKAITLHTNNNERVRIDSSGNLFVGGSTQNTANSPVYAKTTAKAWANWDGTLAGPITPRANFNMSSITKSSTGTYIGNFTVALADANYAAVSSNQPTSIGNVTSATHANSYPNNASSVNIWHRAGGNTSSVPADVAQMSVIVFG